MSKKIIAEIIDDEMVRGKDLIFISQINRDGSGTTKVTDDYIEFMEDTLFTINRLSITYKTYIASEFNSFVVKKREP